MSEKCPVCNSDVEKSITSFDKEPNRAYFSCPRCGPFFLEFSSGDLSCLLMKEEEGTYIPRELTNDLGKMAVLSHWIRTWYESHRSEPTLDRELVESIIKNPPPPITEQKKKLILWLGDNSLPGRSVAVNADIHQSIIGAITSDGFLLVLDDLAHAGLVTPTVVGGSSTRALTCKGREYYEELRRGTTNSHTAFMAMQYNETQLDNIVDNVFRNAVRQTGFDLIVLRDKPKAGLIDDRLRVEIRAARFLIADLTHENAGAYWEAGFAEGLGKQVIYTCEKKKFEGSKTHFDTNHHLTVLWDSDRQEDTAKELKATIRATLPAEAKLTDD